MKCSESLVSLLRILVMRPTFFSSWEAFTSRMGEGQAIGWQTRDRSRRSAVRGLCRCSQGALWRGRCARSGLC